MQAEEVGWGDKGGEDVPLDPPNMRQAIAWSFALRNIRRLETEEAAEELRRETGCEAVKDVKVCSCALMCILSGESIRSCITQRSVAD